MNPEKRLKIFEAFEKHNPSPVTELNYTSPYELMLAVMLSAQMTDKGVNKATEKLFAVANTPAKIVTLGEETLQHYLRSINYYKTKARHILKASQYIIDHFDGQVPATREDLEKLPGIGRKTANVILSVAFDAPTIAVDTHIFRVCNRTKLAPGKTPRAVEDQLQKIVPRQFLKNAHHWLVLHGRYTCIARNPKCNQCIIASFCEFKDKKL
jgi:endonuclease-3